MLNKYVDLSVGVENADVHFLRGEINIDLKNGALFETAIRNKTPSVSDVHRAIAEALAFPSFFNDGLDEYGTNLDSLFDCLTDMSWLSCPAYVVVVRGAEPAWRTFPLDMGRLVTTWLDAALYWRVKQIGFKLVFVMD